MVTAVPPPPPCDEGSPWVGGAAAHAVMKAFVGQDKDSLRTLAFVSSASALLENHQSDVVIEDFVSVCRSEGVVDSLVSRSLLASPDLKKTITLVTGLLPELELPQAECAEVAIHMAVESTKSALAAVADDKEGRIAICRRLLDELVHANLQETFTALFNSLPTSVRLAI